MNSIPDNQVVSIHKKDTGVQRYFGAQPGGGLINVYHFEPDAFGILGARSVEHLLDTLKKHRKQSFNQVKTMLIAYKLVKGKRERILSISMGVDSLGNELLIVVTVDGGQNEEIYNSSVDTP